MGLTFVRVVLPAVIAVAGVVLIVAGGGAGATAAGIALLGVALLVVLANLFMRLGISSERDRELEEASRRHFAEHGRWPDDPADD